MIYKNRTKQYLQDRLKELEVIKKEREWTTAELGDVACCKQTLAFIDSLQEEPVSKDLEEAADKHLVEKGYLLTTNNGEHLAEVEAKGLFKAGAQWQKEQMGKKVDLEKEIHNAADQYDINNNGNIYWEDIVGFAKHFFELGLKAQKGG